MSSEASKAELLAGVSAYHNMLTSKGATVDQMVATSLVELKQLQERDGISNAQILEMNNQALRKLLYTSSMTPKDRQVLKKVFAKLAEIFS